jgi:hypothetical protein
MESGGVLQAQTSVKRRNFLACFGSATAHTMLHSDGAGTPERTEMAAKANPFSPRRPKKVL